MSFVPFTPMDDTVERYGEIISVEYFQTLTNNLNYLLDSIPVGEIRPIYVVGSINVPDPRFWQACDGAAITDLISPLRGFNTPDLVSAVGTINNLSFRAKVPGTVSVTYVQKTNDVSAVKAAVVTNDPNVSISIVAQTGGSAGNAINVTYVADMDYIGGIDVEHVTVSGNSITVHMFYFGTKPGIKGTNWIPFTQASQLVSLINSTTASHALVQATLLSSSPAAFVEEQTNVFLHGGADLISGIGTAGNEVVTVSGNDIQVRLESGVSTIQGIKTKIDSSPAAAALVQTSISPLVGTTTQTAPLATVFISPGVYLKGATTLSVAGFTGGQNSKNLSHNHTGRTANFHLDNNADTDDDRWSARNDHTHAISNDLNSVVSIEPAHVRIKHYIKIN